MDIKISVEISEKEILDKLDILRLERGITMSSFITTAIAEKLKREGYIARIIPHEQQPKKKPQRKKSEMDRILERLRDVTFRRYD